MAIALIARQIKGSADAGKSATSDPADTTGANLIVGAVRLVGAPGGTNMVFTDSKTNTWTPLTHVKNNASGDDVQLFYCASPTVGTGHTFHGTYDDTTIVYPSVAFLAVSGAHATPYAGQVSGGESSTSAVTSQQPGSLTPADNGSLLVTLLGFGVGGTETGGAIDLGFDAQVLHNVGLNYPVALAYLVQGTAAAINPTWSWAGATSAAATMAAFKPAAGGATTYTAPLAPTTVAAGATTTATITPNGNYSGTVTGTPSGTASTGLLAITTPTWSNNAVPKTMAWTPTVAGTLTVTWTNNSGLTNPANGTVTVTAAALAAGVVAYDSGGPAGGSAFLKMTATDATGGTPTYTYQWQRKTGSGGTYANLTNGSGVAGATTRILTDGSATAGNDYFYRLNYTDSAGTPATVSSGGVEANLYTGGALTGGSVPFIGISPLIRGA